MVKYYSPQVTPLDNGKFKYSIRYRDSSFKGVKKNQSRLLRILHLLATKLKRPLSKKLKNN